MFNLEETAEKQFKDVEERFVCNSANAEFIFENNPNEKEKPTVLWVYHSDWDYHYWSYATDCSANNEFYCEFATRCAANLLNTSATMTDDEFFEYGKDADYFIYTGYNWDVAYAKFKDQLDTFKSVQNEEVYDVMIFHRLMKACTFVRLWAMIRSQLEEVIHAFQDLWIYHGSLVLLSVSYWKHLKVLLIKLLLELQSLQCSLPSLPTRHALFNELKIVSCFTQINHFVYASMNLLKAIDRYKIVPLNPAK